MQLKYPPQYRHEDFVNLEKRRAYLTADKFYAAVEWWQQMGLPKMEVEGALYTAMTCGATTCEEHPELKEEFIALLDDHLAEDSETFNTYLDHLFRVNIDNNTDHEDSFEETLATWNSYENRDFSRLIFLKNIRFWNMENWTPVCARTNLEDVVRLEGFYWKSWAGRRV